MFHGLLLALPHSSACLFTLTLASPSAACPVLFCTSLLPGDRPTKNSQSPQPSRPQLPKEQEMRGQGGLCPALTHQLTLSSEQCPALQPGASANLAISGASHTPSLVGEGLRISACNHRVAPALWEKKGLNWSRGNPSQFLTNQCQPHCGYGEGKVWLYPLVF